MRKATLTTALCAVWIIGSLASATPGQASTITVFHGSKAEIFNTDKRPAGGVHVVKQISAPDSTPSPVAATVATQRNWINTSFVAGNTLWTRNDRTGRLVACTVWSAGIVGKDTIRCTNRDSFGR